MKKILFGLVTLIAIVSFADSMFTGVGDNYPGVGTYKITTDGTKATLTIDKIVAGTSISGGSVVSNVTAQTATVSATVTPQAGATVTATGTVAIVGTWVALTNVFDGVTNVFYGPTAVPTATTAINVIGGAGLLTNATATVAGVTTNVLNQRP